MLSTLIDERGNRTACNIVEATADEREICMVKSTTGGEKSSLPSNQGFTVWIVRAFDSGVKELKSFANGLQKDFLAVKEATVSPWSNGQTEGQVNRLKLLKRQMYGRAKFDLLRARVLNPA